MLADPELLLALLPLGGLVVNVFAQIILARTPIALGQVRRQFVSFGIGLIALAATGAGLCIRLPSEFADRAGLLLMAVLSYAFLGFVFFNALNATLSSLRVRLLRELQAREPAGLPAAVLLEKYGATEILHARLDRLATGGQLVQRGDRFYFQPKGVAMIGRFFAALRILLLRSAPS